MKRLLLIFFTLSALAGSAQNIYDTTTLRSRINFDIVTNGTKAITALKLNQILNGYLNTYPKNNIIASSPLSWNATTRTLTLPGWGTALENFANTDLNLTATRNHEFGGFGMNFNNGFFNITTNVLGGKQSLFGVAAGGNFWNATTTSNGGISWQQTANPGGTSAWGLWSASRPTPNTTGFIRLHPDSIILSTTNGNILFKNTKYLKDINARLLVQDTVGGLGKIYHMSIADLATYISGSGGPSYKIGPGLGLKAPDTLYNDLFFKSHFFNNGTGAGGPMMNKVDDSTWRWRRLNIHGTGVTVDTSASTANVFDINLTVSGGSGGGGSDSVLLSGSVMGAAQADINISSLSAYDVLEVTLVEVKPSGNGDPIHIVFSSDGVTFDNTTGQYYWARNLDNSGSGTTAALEPLPYMSNTNYSTGQFKIYRPGSTTRMPRIVGTFGDSDANGNFSNSNFTGRRNNNQATHTIRIKNGGGGTLDCIWYVTGTKAF